MEYYIKTRFSNYNWRFFIDSVTLFGWESMVPLGILAATGYLLLHHVFSLYKLTLVKVKF